MDNLKNYYAVSAIQVIKALQKRHMEGYYCATREEAVAKVLSLIPEQSTVGFGGSETLKHLGLIPRLHEGNYTVYDRDRVEPSEIKKLYHDCLSADYYLLSANAITMDGKLINIDGLGNRLAALVYGPERVIVVVSMNKLVKDEATGLSRARNTAAPANALRLSKNTPCTSVGFCADCNSDDCICSQIVITRNSSVKNRIKVVLVGEPLGF